MSVITVAGQKGGSGKSTLVRNLAILFALDGYKVGIVDADLIQQHSSEFFADRSREGGREVWTGRDDIPGLTVAVWDRSSSIVPQAAIVLAPQADQDSIGEVFGEEGGRGRRSALNQQLIDVMKSIDILRISKGFPSLDRVATRKQRSPRRAFFEPRQANVESRPIRKKSAASNQDHVRMGTFQVDVPPRVLACDPFALARGQCDLPVDRQRKLQRDARTPQLQLRQPPSERLPPRLAADTKRHLDTGLAQASNAFAGGPWVGIL